MRNLNFFAAAALAAALVAAIAFGAYRAGERHGGGQDSIVRIEGPAGTDSGPPVEVVRIEDRRWRFPPFAFIFFPLALFALFLLFRAAFWGVRPGGWPRRDGTPEEWHRSQHESGAPAAR
jgi:hypothetical protein